ncbi:hypothetical protein GCM10008107_05470 [Psychrosphaera saromensis]|uniref:ATP-binding protein n=2 Tax=Psychrosphaera saromensis TaxID=716813 RepID=A0A2S7UWZ7_9GAMM|nr:hypothetical protein [Psychrosphaera saromensis]PQJ54524.1 hypothetical protein BTO11_13285 [Psychrosphaera saromensis]GHB59236.1 hypothetical protein GCM10008107_05470 [Psychrosphaera saromensis]GLQ14268.1 hypothetical protein GCM10007917_17230 [Psychrosphaera saromensis]
MISLPASLDLDKIEDFQKKLDNSDHLDALQIPVGSSKFAFGGFASAIQSVNTWAYFNNERKVVIKPSVKTKNEVLKEIIVQPHKFTALMMAKQTELLKEEAPNVRSEVNQLAKLAIEKQPLEIYGQNRGRLCWYSFVDHSTKGFDRNFYDVTPGYHPSPKSIGQIRSIIKSMVEQSSKVAGGGSLPNKEKINNLGRMFYELFINTHEHGSRDFDRKVWIKPATRVIYSYGINLTDNAISNTVKQEQNFKNYISRLSTTKNSTRRFVEISIVDSGLGYCGRWLADHPNEGDLKDISIKQQYQILKKCFQFRSSSTNNEIKGNGLPAVMANLTNLNGFMKVRSNKLSVFRDFANQPFTSNEEDKFEFSDWETNEVCSNHLTEHPELRGVAITVLIPLYDWTDAKD